MFEVTLQRSGRSFEVPEGRTILDAGLDAGVALPYGCRAAVCSSCRARVAVGEVDLGVVFGTLSPADIAAGYALMCRAKPLTDVVLEIEELRGLDGIFSRKLPCRVIAVERAAADVAILRVRLPNAEGIRFLGGQYADFLLENGERRSLSIATKPSLGLVTELEFHVRRVPGGAFTSRVFDEMQPREVMRIEAPLGTFYLRDDAEKPVILLATGTGFAPIKSIVEAALASGQFDNRQVTVYWGGRTRADLYLLPVAEGWSHPNLRFIPVLSDPTPGCAWVGATGLVHHRVMADFPDLSAHQVYACGATIMVETSRKDFSERCGLPTHEFYADPFLTAGDRADHAAAANAN